MARELSICKLAVLGDEGVGKTALISRFRSKTFVEEFDPTIEDSYTIDVATNGERCALEILDTAGVDEYLKDKWICSNEGFMLVYSITSKPSFIQIQGLYDQIQQIKTSSHPHPSFHVPIILVGNKIDIEKREISLLEGKEMARKLECNFVETSAKDDENVEQSFHAITRQLLKLAKEKALLNDLVNSLPEWYDLLDELKSQISSSQDDLAEANKSPHALICTTNVTKVRQDTRKLPTSKLFRIKLSDLLAPYQRSYASIRLSTLQLPRLLQRQRSVPGFNSRHSPSPPQSLLVSNKEKAGSVDCDMSRPSAHVRRFESEGNYNSLVQDAFEDVIRFLSIFGSRIERTRRQARLENLMARVASDVGDNFICSNISSSVKGIEGTPAADNVEEVDTIQQVKKALNKCQKLCEDVAFENIRYGESKDKIQEMEKQFVSTVKTLSRKIGLQQYETDS